MANINLHWFEETSERLNIDIDLDLKKDIVCLQKMQQCFNSNVIINGRLYNGFPWNYIIMSHTTLQQVFSLAVND